MHRELWIDGEVAESSSACLISQSSNTLPHELSRLFKVPFKSGRVDGDPRALYSGPWPMEAKL